MRGGAEEFSGTERFAVLRELGAGGMGVVYEVLDRQRGVRCALKVLRELEPEAIFRFKNEFHALSDLHHPNLVHLEELFCRDGMWFFTMEYIEGTDLLSWVRGFAGVPETSPTAETLRGAVTLPSGARVAALAGGVLDEARLRAALGQLALGLYVLHGAGKVHRDIKPSNVLVTPEGRVVLLDLGLVADTGAHAEHSHEHVVGTAAFMAPEQAVGKRVGPAADWYAFGVTLYQALTGVLPFQGQQLEILLDKQRLEPPAPHTRVPDVPADLDGLCAELLRFEPAARPTGRAVLARLGVAAPPLPPDSASSSSDPHAVPFVGRVRELAALDEAWAHSHAGERVALLVEGESGVGKSGLVRQFTARVEGVVLAGRCYERESVPYKAFDGVVDALSRHLRRLGRDEAAAMLPAGAELLPMVFPVLGRVPALAQLPRPPAPIVDPQELRARMFAALRELLDLLAARAPLVLVIDDLQWSDGDSLALLAELMRPAAVPGLLVVATLRPGGDPSVGITPAAVEAALGGAVRRLRVERLPPDDARELARLLLARDTPDAPASADVIAAEAGGHPLFIDELVRHWVAGGAAPGPLRLDDALAARVQQLDAPVRQLVELVAVAGAPLAQDVAREAAGSDVADFGKYVALLRVAHLVRGVKVQGDDAIEPYHDRVREAILQRLDSETRLRCHERLAIALEVAGNADAERLAVHWREAGAADKAGSYAAAAAAQAAAALAFDRAARLYRRALESRRWPAAEARALRSELGHALANAGRGAEAAEAYTAAARDANPAERLELQRRAAVQLLQSGRVDDGLAALRSVLEGVGMKMAQSRAGAIVSFALRRAHIALRGVGWRERDATEVPPELLQRIDVAFSVTESLGMVDYTHAADFQARHLLLALAAGEPSRVVQALCSEANFRVMRGRAGTRSATALLRRARLVAERRDDPYLLALTDGSGGIVAFQSGDWRTCLEHTARAEALFRDRCTGVAWELSTVRLFHLFALNLRGQLGEMNARLGVLLKSAEERGDLYSDVAMRTSVGYCRFLAADDPAAGQRDLADALARWSPKRFNLERMNALMSAVFLDLYAGEAVAASQRLEAARAEVEGSGLLRAALLRGIYLTTSARAAMAAAARRDDEAAWQAVARYARALERQELPFCHAFARLARARLSWRRSDAAEALELLQRAETEMAACDLGLFRQAVRHLRGRLVGGESGRALMVEADSFLRGESVRVPERLFEICTPGW